MAANAKPGTPSLTDSSGAFVLTGLAEGRYELSASSSLGQATQRDVPTGATNVGLRMAVYGAISGSVRSPDGTPADTFQLVYRRTSDNDLRSMNGAQGEWSLPWLPPGHYRVSAIAASGCGWADAQLTAGGNVQVAISLDQTDEAACGSIWRSDRTGVPTTGSRSN
jgi:hypothetical protein